MPDISTNNPLRLLAVPGERFGWVFRNRNLYRRRFPEPPPTPGMVPPDLVKRLEVARRHMPKRIGASLGVGFGLMLAFSCCAGIGDTAGGGVGVFGFLTFAAFGGGVAGAVGAWVIQNRAQGKLTRTQEAIHRDYQNARADWDRRRMEFDRQQQRTVDEMLEWGAATPSPGTRRVDIIGGSTWGWEALLTVFGSSLLSTRGPMILVDFTGEALCDELISLAEQTGNRIRLTALPSQLGELNLTAGLETRDLVNSLVESMYGDSQGSSRADRAQDSMLLTELCEVLGSDVTMARIAAGLRVLTDRSGQPALSAEECERVLDLLPDDARRQAYSNLRRIEGFLRPLVSMGSAVTDMPSAALTCLIADPDGRSAQDELLKDLIVQWLIRQMSREATRIGSILIIGADEVHHRHIERLSTMCERRNIRLVLFFEHLRDESLHSLGGGEVGFMRLGNHQEAQQAAEFIGRQHKFVLSQLTRTLGGNETHTDSDTEGYSETAGESSGTSSGQQFSRQRGVNRSRTRNWSQTQSLAAGTNWSDAASAQRVYEFAVEPRVLQELPDYALLLVKAEGRGSVVQGVECDPAISTLPRMTMDPLPNIPFPSPSEAAIPVPGAPTYIPVFQPVPTAPHHMPPRPSHQTPTGIPDRRHIGPGQQYQPPPFRHPPQQ